MKHLLTSQLGGWNMIRKIERTAHSEQEFSISAGHKKSATRISAQLQKNLLEWNQGIKVS